eukprot:CAMPEP_0204875542 /NCGR_PEP_ID=MMETSP1348-20121228/46205_1 /ASSEMBLY_ACC=CAM_ASM_000700 /TAXON_ID=215587 /ORGANISM="Aplanochytrium stocchinoi, Strain GSBS06" /LENGTH=234 /DNA_ID=CAMNT_0052032039 /DNA_START=385 /DNA_END=1089 /DNA_ORIENTATION=-
MAAALICNRPLRERIIRSINSAGEYDDLLEAGRYPIVERLVSLYGLLGRQTPLTISTDKKAVNLYESFVSFVVDVGVNFIFKLYDHPILTDENLGSTLTDLDPGDLKTYANETLLICGLSDPMLLCNQEAHKMLQKKGFNVTFETFSGTHAFHGFPVNWSKYVNYDWTENAMPATYSMATFLTGGKWNKNKHALSLSDIQQNIVKDRTPLIVFPIFFVVLPTICYYGFVFMMGI